MKLKKWGLKAFLPLAIVLFSTFSTNAQDTKESIQQELKKCSSKDSIWAYLRLSSLDFNRDYKASILSAEKALFIAKRTNDLWGVHKSKYRMAIAMMDTGNTEKGIQIVLESREWFRNNKHVYDATLCSFNLGRAYERLVQNDKAIVEWEECLITYRKLKKWSEVKNTFDRLGSVYYNMGLLNKSMDMVDSSLVYCEITGDEKCILAKKGNKATAMFQMGRIQEGLDVSLEVIRLSEKNNQMDNGMLAVLSNMGLAYSIIGDMPNALKYARYAVELSEKLGNQNGIVKAKGVIAYLLQNEGKFQESINLFNEIISICRDLKDKNTLIKFLSSKAYAHEVLGQYDSVLTISTQIFKEGITQKVSRWEMDGYLMSGSVYTQTGDYVEARAFFEKALVIADSIPDMQTQIKVFYEIANTYFHEKEYKKAERYLKRTLDVVKTFPSQAYELDSYLCLAQIAVERNNFTEVRFWLDKVDSKGNKSEILEGVSYLNLKAQVLAHNGDLKTAIEKLQQALAISLKTKSYLDLLNSYDLLVQVNEQKGNYKDALYYHKQAQAKRDSSQSTETKKTVAELQAQYELIHKENEISNLQRDKEVAYLKAEKEQQELVNFRTATVFVLALLIAIGWGLFSRYRNNKAKKEAELIAQQLLLQKENLIANRQVEMAELKNEFYANVSHEFRTPLTLIKAPLEKLMETEDIHKSTYEMMWNNSNQLLEMINEVLELSKSTEGLNQVEMETVSMKIFTRTLTEKFKPLAASLNVQFSLKYTAEREIIEVDKKKLSMVLNNLLKNAFEYTPEKGKVTIRVDQESSSNELLIAVINTGSIINEKDIPHLFDRHYRAENNGQDGNGIGLHICKEMIHLLNGRIEIQSIENETSFLVYLPIAHAVTEQNLVNVPVENLDVEETWDRVEELKDQENTILIVEDHEEMRHFISESLKMDFKIITAQNGKEALIKIEKSQPDLIISDVMMPGIDGFELTQQLKQDIATSHIPIVLLTAKAGIESKIQGLELEADDYLVKPFNFKELQTRVRNLIKQRKTLQEQFSKNPTALKKLGRNPLDQEFLAKARLLVLRNLSKVDFSTQEFCEQMAMNRTSVHQKFKGLLKMSTSQFIRTIKAQKAVELINEGKLSLAEIAVEAGFNSRQSFIKSFKEQFSMTPSEYKNQLQRTQDFSVSDPL